MIARWRQTKPRMLFTVHVRFSNPSAPHSLAQILARGSRSGNRESVAVIHDGLGRSNRPFTGAGCEDRTRHLMITRFARGVRLVLTGVV